MSAEDSAQPASGHATTHVLGKYRLIARLARGGMGVLYLAVLRGPKGFHKLVAIKELRRELADDEALVAMFMAEARLAAQLNHPNIVQTMEVGSTAGRHFLAMEYLEGQSLHRLMQRANERGAVVPLAVHLNIALDLLSGLEYAHDLTGFDGTPLGVVHRDVSPHNVFLTYEGQSKLVDFGIAKTHDNLDGPLGAGVQGKTRYMSPEQAACEPVDRRADLFSVGVILWEAIVGRRPWDGRPEAAVLQSLLKGSIPRVREARPDADEDLAAIVDRAMSVDPEERYPTALALRDELEACMTAKGIAPFGTRALSTWMTQLFADDRQRLRKLIDSQLKALDEPPRAASSSPPGTQLSMSMAVPAESAPATAAPGSTPPPSPARSGSSAPTAPLEATAPAPAESDRALPSLSEALRTLPASDGASPLRGVVPLAHLLSESPKDVAAQLPASGSSGVATRPWVMGLGAALGAALALAAFAVGRSSAGRSAAAPSAERALATPAPASIEEPSPRPARVSVRASPSTAAIYLDDVLVQNPYVAEHARDGTAHSLRVEADGYETKESSVSFLGDIDIAMVLGVADPPRPSARDLPRAPAHALGSAPAPAASLSASEAVTAPLSPPPPPPVPAKMPGPKPIDTGNPYNPSP